jgi:hypothetical protein
MDSFLTELVYAIACPAVVCGGFLGWLCWRVNVFFFRQEAIPERG